MKLFSYRPIAAALFAAFAMIGIANAQNYPPSPAAPAFQPSGIGLTIAHRVSAASLNPSVIVAGRHVLYGVNAFNTNAATMFLKFYNKATAPVCGTDTRADQNPPCFGAAFFPGFAACFVLSSELSITTARPIARRRT